MSKPRSEITASDGGDSDDSLLRALSRTPEVRPFDGTDRYRVCRSIGEGGFGVVYEVEDRDLGRRLALKTLKRDAGDAGATIRRLKREFRSVADLVHPNLVGLHELASDGQIWFFTMDLVRGCSFLEYVSGQIADADTQPADGLSPWLRRTTTGVLSEARLRASLRQLVEGVRALHEAGIIHRDLKPSNVLVELDGRVVILDFGLAGPEGETGRGPQAFDDPQTSLRGGGTLAYMAPEQAVGEAITPAADWYAVGVMLYQALTGWVPFEQHQASPIRMAHAKRTQDPEPPSSHGPVPDDLERLCVALLARRPEDRPDAATILRMLGAGRAENEVARTVPPAVFVGRHRELAAMNEAYRRARTGRRSLVRVEGQPGVGKSTLIQRFLLQASEPREGGPVVLVSRCHERESVPFKAFDGVMDALVRFLGQLPRHQGSALMPRDIHLVSRLFPVLDSIPAVRDVPRRPHTAPDPREARAQAFAAIKELLGRMADKWPLIVAIDDLQWGDMDSARLLSQVLAPPDAPRLLLLLAYRVDDVEQSESLRETLRTVCASYDESEQARIEVEPLPAEDAEQLAASWLGDEQVPRGAARAIAQRGEGHPLFMAELARELVLEQPTDATPSLIDMLWRRVMRLPQQARALVEIVALAGAPLESKLCFEAAGLGSRGVDALRALRSEQLVRTSSGIISVFHDRVRDAVLARADAETRRMRHLGLARSLERETRLDLEALCHHYGAAGERERAGDFAARAGDSALETLAFRRAAALYELAIAHRGELANDTLYQKLGDALLCDGSNVAAGQAYLAAAERSDGPRAVDLTRLAAQQILVVGERDMGFRVLDEALEAVGEGLPRTLGRASFEMIFHLTTMRLGGFRFREREDAPPDALLRLDVLDSAAKALASNDMPRGMAVGARFCRRALKLGEPRRAALGLVGAVIAFLPGSTSYPPAADALLDRAIAVGERVGDPRVGAYATFMRGKLWMLFGNWTRAAELLGRAGAIISERCRDMLLERREGLAFSGVCRLRTGDLDGARRLAAHVLLDADERRDPVTAKLVLSSVMAHLALVADEPAEALELLGRVRLEDRCASVLFKAESAAALAQYGEQPRAAVEAWRSRWGRIEEYGLLMLPAFRAIAVRSLGSALLVSAESRGELREAARLMRSVRRLKFAYARAVVAQLEGYRARRTGAVDRSAAFLAEAAGLYDEANMPLDAAACRRRWGQWVGGDEGSRTIARVDDMLGSRGIACPERWSATIVPAFPAARAPAQLGAAG